MDCQTYHNAKPAFPQLAIALAYAAVQLDIYLWLKICRDEDVEIQYQSETVNALVNRNFELLKKELKL